MSAERERFLRAALAGAAQAAREGAPIHPQAAAAHAANESRYGESQLATKAKNLFGVKATGKQTAWWDGSTVTMPTWEVENGKNVTIDAAFRAYPDWPSAFSDYGDIIERVYPNAVAGKDRDLTFLAGLFLTGPYKWATDPSAFSKAAAIIAQYADVLYDRPPVDDAAHAADTLVLDDLTLADRWRILFKTPAALSGAFVWRARGSKLDARRA